MARSNREGAASQRAPVANAEQRQVEIIKQPFYLRQKRSPHIGQRYLSGRPLKQLYPQCILQLFNTSAQSRLRYPDCIGSPTKATFFNHGPECLQII